MPNLGDLLTMLLARKRNSVERLPDEQAAAQFAAAEQAGRIPQQIPVDESPDYDRMNPNLMNPMPEPGFIDPKTGRVPDQYTGHFLPPERPRYQPQNSQDAADLAMLINTLPNKQELLRNVANNREMAAKTWTPSGPTTMPPPQTVAASGKPTPEQIRQMLMAQFMDE